MLTRLLVQTFNQPGVGVRGEVIRYNFDILLNVRSKKSTRYLRLMGLERVQYGLMLID